MKRQEFEPITAEELKPFFKDDIEPDLLKRFELELYPLYEWIDRNRGYFNERRENSIKIYDSIITLLSFKEDKRFKEHWIEKTKDEIKIKNQKVREDIFFKLVVSVVQELAIHNTSINYQILFHKLQNNPNFKHPYKKLKFNSDEEYRLSFLMRIYRYVFQLCKKLQIKIALYHSPHYPKNKKSLAQICFLIIQRKELTEILEKKYKGKNKSNKNQRGLDAICKDLRKKNSLGQKLVEFDIPMELLLKDLIEDDTALN